jgi:hypothetical protein
VEQKERNGRKRAALPWVKPSKKVLWGREFKLVKAGLDVEQVADLVNALMAESNAAVDPLLEMTMEDAERLATNIRTDAAEKAQAEAEKIIKQVQEDAEEMKRQAEAAAEKEGENAFAEIKKRAESMEAETKKKTLIYLVRAREQIEKEIREEYEAAYSRLFSSVQEIMNVGQDLEAELRRKRVALMESKYFELAESVSTLLDIPNVSMSDIESAAGAAAEVRSDVLEKEETEPVQAEQQEKVEEPTGEEHETVEIEEQPEETVQEAEGMKAEEPPQVLEKLEETLQELGETIHELEGMKTGGPVRAEEEEVQQEIGEEEGEPVRAERIGRASPG